MEDPFLPKPFVMSPVSSQGPDSNDNIFRVYGENPPQSREFADKPGTYSIVCRMSLTTVDPGDTLNIELYFTGYGVIEGGKLLLFPPPGIFDENESNITAGCKQIGEIITFGSKSWPMVSNGSFWIEVNNIGVKAKDWKCPTIFFDVTPDSHLIFTETALPWTPKDPLHGPVTLSLKTKDEAKPGQYDIRFALTYYNGESWVTSSETAPFSVTTWYQRHETCCQILFIIAAVIAFASFVAQLFDAIFGTRS